MLSPEPIQLYNTFLRRIARNDSGIIDSIEIPATQSGCISFRQRLIDTSLIGSKRAAALQQKGNAFKWRAFIGPHHLFRFENATGMKA